MRETLAPQIAERSPDFDPNPAAILALKVIDPATGSGHFLVEACRYLAEALYAACRMCDEGAAAAETTRRSASPDDWVRLLARAATLRRRLAELPDPDGLLLAYLPSRSSEGGASGFRSPVHWRSVDGWSPFIACMGWIDNRLAIELAKLSLWLESYAEGLPLTFLDHRLVHADSIAGPFFASLATLPVGRRVGPIAGHDVGARLSKALNAALHEVEMLQARVGADAADLALKAAAKRRLDATLRPLRLLAYAWSGAVMLATHGVDDEWLALARAVAGEGAWPEVLTERQEAMLATGSQALAWDLAFAEVFRPDGAGRSRAVASMRC